MGMKSCGWGSVIVVPANACERRDPYSAAFVVEKDKITTTSQGNCGRWLWVPAFAGTTEELSDSIFKELTHLRLLATLIARGLQFRLPSPKTEGAGKTGCLLHPRSRVRFALTKLHTSIQGSWNTPAFPAQWLYGLLRALPGERLFCLRRRRDTSRQLSASTAAPKPHDFAVRFRRVRLSRPQRPPHLTARS
jgi:hypothetical protein